MAGYTGDLGRWQKTHPLGDRLRSWRRGPFTLYDLSMTPQGMYDRAGRMKLGYKLTHRGKTIFQGTDFGAAYGAGADSNETAGALLGFLSLRPGDTDPEHFEHYTKAQLDFANRYSDELTLWSEDLEGVGDRG